MDVIIALLTVTAADAFFTTNNVYFSSSERFCAHQHHNIMHRHQHTSWHQSPKLPINFIRHRDNSVSPLHMSTKDATEDQLQKRFEDAMRRRKERRGELSIVSETVDAAKAKESSIHDMVETTEENEDMIEGDDFSNNMDTTILKVKEPENDRDVTSNNVKPASKRRQNVEKRIVNPQDNNRKRPPQHRSDERQTSGRYNSSDRYEDRDLRYEEDQYSWDNTAYEDDMYSDNKYSYDDDDDQRDTASTTTRTIPAPTCEWETYRSTSILFPPRPKQQTRRKSNNGPTRPNAIIHFVGGTFFGSYPRKFYGTLLEELAVKCNAVVVATPIPLVLPGKTLVNKLEQWMFDEGGTRSRNEQKSATNPLDHLSLAESIQKEFNTVYRDVILDEYGDYADQQMVEDFMTNVPIIGIGHSLGARIQAISCSHPNISQRYLSMGKGNQLIRSGREGMVYLGFANWRASSSIPGVETLDTTIKKKERERRLEEKQRRGAGRRDDVRDERSTRGSRRRSSYDIDNDRKRRQRYSRYEAEDLDLVDVFGDVVTDVVKGAKQISEALTPESEDLEFTPTPNELWEDISASDGYYSQSAKSNLIVQFDDDPIDQGSRLARTLLNTHKAGADGSNSTKAEESVLQDVKFARLSGGHLTPVTVQEGIAKVLPKGAVSILSSSYNFIIRQLDDERMGKSSRKQQREVKDMADTVASYINSLGGIK